MNQKEAILTHLKAGGSIELREAIALYGCHRLGARIYDLRRAGHNIDASTVETVNRYGHATRFARYSLIATA